AVFHLSRSNVGQDDLRRRPVPLRRPARERQGRDRLQPRLLAAVCVHPARHLSVAAREQPPARRDRSRRDVRRPLIQTGATTLRTHHGGATTNRSSWPAAAPSAPPTAAPARPRMAPARKPVQTGSGCPLHASEQLLFNALCTNASRAKVVTKT